MCLYFVTTSGIEFNLFGLNINIIDLRSEKKENINDVWVYLKLT